MSGHLGRFSNHRSEPSGCLVEPENWPVLGWLLPAIGNRNIFVLQLLKHLNTDLDHEHPPISVHIDRFIHFNDCVAFYGTHEA